MIDSDGSCLDVLIAEPDVLVRQSLRALLEGQGYTCAEANNGQEAIALARQYPPRFVLLDLAVQESGLAVARTLRADPLTRRTHIYGLTGQSDPEAQRQAQEAGCDRLLPKPVDVDVLLQAVQGPKSQETSVTGLTLAEAEGLLDWLENQGVTERKGTIDESGVTVRFVCPHGGDQAR
jgi:CheY-like chemotaxis protein